MSTVFQPQESIIPLIKICRKLHGLNVAQANTILNQIPNLFQKYNQQALFIHVLKSIICYNYHLLPTQLLLELEQLLPKEKQLSINDSITNSSIPIENQAKDKDEQNQKF